MTLKYVTETVHNVEVNDLKMFIREQTGHSYEIVPNEEWGNDEQHRIIVDGDMSGWAFAYWTKFKSTGDQDRYRTRDIMNGLCADGKLPAGIYVINVSW